MLTHLQSPPHGGLQGQVNAPTEDGPVSKFADGPWGEVENGILRDAIEKFQGHPIRTDIVSAEKDKDRSLKWSGIASHCQARGCRRSAKQCRERYINHMAPGRRDKILPDEGRHIMTLVSIHGQKWALIGRELNRPENTVKNYWNQERKKRENGKKRASSHSHPSHQSATGRQHSARTYPYPQVSHEHFPSRRDSFSSNPGLVSDHGSPVECSPRSSRHNSFGPVQQLPLPPFQEWKPAPASPLQSSHPMDRTQSLSTSSAYSSGLPHIQGRSPTHENFYRHDHPSVQHHREGHGYYETRAQMQERSSVDSMYTRTDSGFEHPSRAYGHNQGGALTGLNTSTSQPTLSAYGPSYSTPRANIHERQAHRQHLTSEQESREQYHESRAVRHSSAYSYTVPQQTAATPQMDTPRRVQRENLHSVSAMVNATADVYQTPEQVSAVASSSKPRFSQGFSEKMAIKSILN